MITIYKQCENCNKYTNILCDTIYCNKCEYMLQYIIKLYQYFYFIITNLKIYQTENIKKITLNLIKMINITKKSNCSKEFNYLYNETLVIINNLKISNDKVEKQYLKTNTQTFLFLQYK